MLTIQATWECFGRPLESKKILLRAWLHGVRAWSTRVLESATHNKIELVFEFTTCTITQTIGECQHSTVFVDIRQLYTYTLQ